VVQHWTVHIVPISLGSPIWKPLLGKPCCEPQPATQWFQPPGLWDFATSHLSIDETCGSWLSQEHLSRATHWIGGVERSHGTFTTYTHSALRCLLLSVKPTRPALSRFTRIAAHGGTTNTRRRQTEQPQHSTQQQPSNALRELHIFVDCPTPNTCDETDCSNTPQDDGCGVFDLDCTNVCAATHVCTGATCKLPCPTLSPPHPPPSSFPSLPSYPHLGRT